jgi:hypothetical protein
VRDRDWLANGISEDELLVDDEFGTSTIARRVSTFDESSSEICGMKL